LRITWAEQFAAAAAQQIFPGEGVLFGHARAPQYVPCAGTGESYWLARRAACQLIMNCCVVVVTTARYSCTQLCDLL
jgi:hypothetical protein